MGEPGSERRTRPLDIALLTSPDFWKSEFIPEFLRDTVFQLRFLQGMTVELLTESGRDGWTVPISILSDEEGEIDSQLFIAEPDGSSRLRRASVFAFKRAEKHMCAVVIEFDPVHMKLYPTTGQGSDQVWQTLRYATADFLKGLPHDSGNSSLSDLIHWAFNLREK